MAPNRLAHHQQSKNHYWLAIGFFSHCLVNFGFCWIQFKSGLPIAGEKPPKPVESGCETTNNYQSTYQMFTKSIISQLKIKSLLNSFQ
jgi:hypothetical protein